MKYMNIKHALKTYFGYDEFKKGQQKLIEETLKGRDVLGGNAYWWWQVPLLSIACYFI